MVVASLLTKLIKTYKISKFDNFLFQKESINQNGCTKDDCDWDYWIFFEFFPGSFPDVPELNYANLEGSVQHGGDAMTQYPAIAKMAPAEAEATRKSLLEYCKLDTYAMLKIWQKLKELSDL